MTYERRIQPLGFVTSFSGELRGVGLVDDLEELLVLLELGALPLGHVVVVHDARGGGDVEAALERDALHVVPAGFARVMVEPEPDSGNEGQVRENVVLGDGDLPS
jgi:hypothetical protein